MGRSFLQRAAWAWVAFSGVVVGSPAARAQPAATPVSYHLTRYTGEQGLPHNNVRALLQTRDGYLWVGTLAGLARFDGVRFKVFDMNNTPEMSHDGINALAEDAQDGSLWINTGNELLRYHGHRFERFHEQNGFPHPYGDLWPARQGGLWYSPSYGRLVLLQNRKIQAWQLLPERVFGTDIGILAHCVLQVEEEEAGSLLVLMHLGLARFDPAKGTLTLLGPRTPGQECRFFHTQTDGTILVAAREGLWQRTGTEWRQIETVPPGEHRCPAQICPANDGALWIPWSGEGPPRVARFRAGHSESADLSGLPDYELNRFLEDREGHLWLGTASGLCQLRRKAVRVFAREDGLRNDFVKSLTEGPDSTIWIGTAHGVSAIKNGEVTNLPPVEPSNWGRAEGLLADRRGRVWYGVRADTVAAFEHGSWGSSAPLQLGNSWVRTLYEDRLGRIWAGFDRGVAWLSETGGVHSLDGALSQPDVRCIHQDRCGDFWFGTYGGGLNRWHDGQISSFSTDKGEYNNRCWCIHEDADGIFWIGTRNGLNRFVPPGPERTTDYETTGLQDRDATTVANAPVVPRSEGRVVSSSSGPVVPKGRFFTFTTRHGLHENVVNSVQEDDFGYLWLSGPQGIYRVSRKALNEVAAGHQAQAQVLALGEADGMLNSQCNGGANQPSGCKDRAGRIWFPTARGVAMVDPRTVRLNGVAPRVVIEQVRADDVVIFGDDAPVTGSPEVSSSGGGAAPGTRYRLAPGHASVLEIHYTANSFAEPHRMRFRYRLEGYDRDWREGNVNQRVAFYTGLPPAAYTFQVMACNNHGVWSETPAAFAFTLAPHFWQTWWFYLGAGVVVLGLGGAIQAYRLQWQRRLLGLEHQNALGQERTRIARDLHDELGANLTGLALRLDLLGHPSQSPEVLHQSLARLAQTARGLVDQMREVIWAVNPQHDNVDSLAAFLGHYTENFLGAAGLRCRLDLPAQMPRQLLSSHVRYQLFLVVKEALHNVVRHARATEARLGLELLATELRVMVADNGCGLAEEQTRTPGHGLHNMENRVAGLGGHFSIRSSPGEGTRVSVSVPIEPGRAGNRGKL